MGKLCNSLRLKITNCHLGFRQQMRVVGNSGRGKSDRQKFLANESVPEWLKPLSKDAITQGFNFSKEETR